MSKPHNLAVQAPIDSPEVIDPRLAAHRGKRVLLVAPQPFFLNRGTPLNVRRMVENLAEFGLQVDLLVYPVGDDVALKGVRVFRALRPPFVKEVPIGPSLTKVLLDFFLVFSALKLSVQQRYAIYHGIEEGAFITGALALLRGAKNIFDMDSCMPTQLADSKFIRSPWVLRFIELLERFWIRRAAAVLTVCEALTKKALSATSRVPVYQIEDAPSDDDVPVSETQVLSAKKQLGLIGKKIIVYTGNFEKYQGIDLLLESFSAYLASGVPETAKAHLLLVGGGALESPIVQKYSAQAEQLGIAQQVTFLGNRPGSEMSLYLALADVLVSPRTEGANTPLKVYSYMASGKPLAATAIYSHTQALDEENAYLGAPNVSGFAAALNAALSEDPVARAEQQRRAISAQAKVERCYSAVQFKKKLSRLYADLLS